MDWKAKAEALEQELRAANDQNAELLKHIFTASRKKSEHKATAVVVMLYDPNINGLNWFIYSADLLNAIKIARQGIALMEVEYNRQEGPNKS